MSANNYYVYALLREDKTPFYIGASCDPNRHNGHIYGKNPLVIEMRSRGVKPGLKIIKKQLSRIEALDMERDIIAGIGLDHLTNGNGGIGKTTVSTEEWLRAGKCRDARSLLGWSMIDLAEAARTDLWTIINFELTSRPVSPEVARDIRLALENSGIMFIDGDGVSREGTSGDDKITDRDRGGRGFCRNRDRPYGNMARSGGEYPHGRGTRRYGACKSRIAREANRRCRPRLLFEFHGCAKFDRTVETRISRSGRKLCVARQ
jgi:hypothetical protein